jgi:hypothetical protein
MEETIGPKSKKPGGANAPPGFLSVSGSPYEKE